MGWAPAKKAASAASSPDLTLNLLYPNNISMGDNWGTVMGLYIINVCELDAKNNVSNCCVICGFFDQFSLHRRHLFCTERPRCISDFDNLSLLPGQPLNN